jgi:hypothetical protein
MQKTHQHWFNGDSTLFSLFFFAAASVKRIFVKIGFGKIDSSKQLLAISMVPSGLWVCYEGNAGLRWSGILIY